MEYHKETPCVTIFISNKQKHHAALFIFSLLQNQRRGGQNISCKGEGREMSPVGGGKWWGRRIGG
jgi:hypothetical protein